MAVQLHLCPAGEGHHSAQQLCKHSSAVGGSKPPCSCATEGHRHLSCPLPMVPGLTMAMAPALGSCCRRAEGVGEGSGLLQRVLDLHHLSASHQRVLPHSWAQHGRHRVMAGFLGTFLAARSCTSGRGPCQSRGLQLPDPEEPASPCQAVMLGMKLQAAASSPRVASRHGLALGCKGGRERLGGMGRERMGKEEGEGEGNRRERKGRGRVEPLLSCCCLS